MMFFLDSALVGVLIILLLGGCSTFRPYIDLPMLRATSGKTLPNLCLAINDIEDQRVKEVQYRRNEQVIIRNSLGLITFGAAAGAGAAALFGAHRDTVLGFGVASAASYTGGTLFFGPERSRLYDAGNRALYCIANAGHGTVSASETIEMQAGADGAYEKTKKQIADILDPLKRSWTSPENVAAKANAEQAIAAYELAKLNFEEFQASDASLALNVKAAGGIVIGTLNEELGKIEPSPDAILNAARSVGALATSFRTTAEKKEQPPVTQLGVSVPEEASDQERKQLEGLTQDLNEAATAINKTVRTATNALADLSSICALHVPKIEALAASQTEVQINKDQTFVIEITGGKLPLDVHLDWNTA